MLNKVLHQIRTVAIGGHIRPDGDCVGACMGLYQYIQEHYKEIQVDVYLENIPESFHFIEALNEVHSVIKEDIVYDLFIALDCGDAQRLGFAKPLFEEANHTFCVDHHISNSGFAEENYIKPDASSTSELVYRLLDSKQITKKIAECLYLGIAHDTGVFQYTCTSPRTMEIAAELMRTGIDASAIINDTYYQKTYRQNQVLGRALLGSFLLMNGQCISSSISKEQMAFYCVTPSDLEGIVSQLRMTEGVEVAIFMYELEAQEYKISLRSNGDIDVSAIAQYFGGGGHKKAAGFTMKGTSHDVTNNLTRQIELQLAELER
ncbi:MAG: bifunctional oligoribonuclease/PAP phosphatase NrnA [Lachnospiraceae bacterium]